MNPKRTAVITVIVGLLAAAGLYSYASSTSNELTSAREGRVLDSASNQPVPDAWVIGQWKAYYRGVHGSERGTVVAAEVVRTDSNGGYRLQSQAGIDKPAGDQTASVRYAFGLLVYAPGHELDETRSPYCATVGSPPAPFLCPPAKADAGALRLDPVYVTAASADLASRAQAVAQWNAAAFVDTKAAPVIQPRGTQSVAIGERQAQELEQLACAAHAPVPYPVVDAILATLRWPMDTTVPPSNAFKTTALAGPACTETADRCPAVDAAKVCAGIHAALAHTHDHGAQQ